MLNGLIILRYFGAIITLCLQQASLILSLLVIVRSIELYSIHLDLAISFHKCITVLVPHDSVLFCSLGYVRVNTNGIKIGRGLPNLRLLLFLLSIYTEGLDSLNVRT